MDTKPEAGIKMSDEELKKEVEETTTQDAPIEETNDTSNEEPSKEEKPLEKQEESKGEDKPESIDYEAELEKVKEERENYKQGMLSAKSKLKENKETPKVDVDEITKQVADQVKQQIDSHLVADRADFLEDTLEGVSNSPKEKELIKYHYENTINKSGYTKSAIANDLANAKILANKSKLIEENDELRRALLAKASVSNVGVGSTYRRQEEKSEVDLSDADKAFLSKRKIDPKRVKNEIK